LSMVTAQRDTREEKVLYPKIQIWDVTGFTVINFFSSEFLDLSGKSHFGQTGGNLCNN
jgi:hypothetical protein